MCFNCNTFLSFRVICPFKWNGIEMKYGLDLNTYDMLTIILFPDKVVYSVWFFMYKWIFIWIFLMRIKISHLHLPKAYNHFAFSVESILEQHCLMRRILIDKLFDLGCFDIDIGGVLLWFLLRTVNKLPRLNYVLKIAKKKEKKK